MKQFCVSCKRITYRGVEVTRFGSRSSAINDIISSGSLLQSLEYINAIEIRNNLLRESVKSFFGGESPKSNKNKIQLINTVT